MGRLPTPVFLPGESQGQGSLVGCRLWGHTESDTTEVTWRQQHGQTEVTLQDTAMGPLRRKSSKRRGSRVFPGCPVVKTLHFQCRGEGLIPGYGSKIPRALQHGQEKGRGLQMGQRSYLVLRTQGSGVTNLTPTCSDILVKQLGIRELKKLHQFRAKALRAQAISCVERPLGE